GGLLYATCLILKAENAAQVDAFLAGHEDAEPVTLPGVFGNAIGAGRQRFPGMDGLDGFFYACMRKRQRFRHDRFMHRALECAAGDRLKPMVQSTPSPWLSVLVPVYGVERWIRQCMESVLSQADDGVEILVLDDASPDGSMAIVHELQQRHPGRIRVLEHPRNRGLSAARNSLMDAATGRYFWFLDSDDVLLPGAIERLRGVVAREAPDLVLCDFRVQREDSGLLHRLRGEMHRHSFAGRTRAGSGRDALLAGLLEARQFHAWSKIATAGIWRAARFPEGRYFEDIAVIAPL